MESITKSFQNGVYIIDLNASWRTTPCSVTVAQQKTYLSTGGIQTVLDTIFADAMQRAEQETYYIRKYVNEETLCQINPRWEKNMDTFKEVYGEDVFAELRKYMYLYGITDETSILMFLCTIGDETGYGTNVVQGGDNSELENSKYRKNMENVPVISDQLGIGLCQVTDDAQRLFIRDKYISLQDEDPEKIRMEEYFNISNDYFDKYEKWETPELDNAAGYICLYYPIEASVWYWASLDTKCATFDDQGNQTNYAINDYIVYYDNLNANMDNVFLGVEYVVNSLPKAKENYNIRMNKGDVEDICKMVDAIADKESTEILLEDERSYPMPMGWWERKDDWDRAKMLMEQ